MEAENRIFEKENHLPKAPFLGSMLVLVSASARELHPQNTWQQKFLRMSRIMQLESTRAVWKFGI